MLILQAFMGTCYSLPTNPDLSGQNRPLLLEKESDEMLFLFSHVHGNREFFKHMTKILHLIEDSVQQTDKTILVGSGLIPPEIENTELNQIRYLTTVWFIPTSVLPSAYLTRVSIVDFILTVRDSIFILPNYERILRNEISFGYFKDGILEANKNDYRQIWEILTSGRQYYSYYTQS